MMTPQALIMLMVWPVVVAMIFSRMPRAKAIVWSILAGYLVLPPVAAIDLPLFPSLDKAIIPALSAAFFCYIGKSDDEIAPPKLSAPILVLLVMMLAAPLLTTVTNTDTLVEGISVRPGAALSQGIAESMLVFAHLLPFLLGYWYLSTPQGVSILARALVTGMLAYSVLMIIEVRLSPQMNVWIYGYFQHDFVQTMRYGGFRPIVFLEHPLWVAFLCMTSLLCAIAITRVMRDSKWYATSGYLGVILLMCKSLGVLLHCVIALPFLWFARPRLIVTVAMFLGIAVVSYPVVRAQPWMPIEGIVATASGTDADRGQSLEFRLVNETRLLQRALERPAFGWGGWGRPLIVDPVSARYETITDGEWIRLLGERGIFGFVAEFGLLLLPIIMAWRAWPRNRGKPDEADMTLAAIAMIMGLNMVDLIPNATLTPISWLMTGMLAGSAVRMRQGQYFTQTENSRDNILHKKTVFESLI
ncbi:hypothetical protein [Paracoccus sp. (in: a-proteobacteria)]|uniref:hypothetical protein n=1 Tax=Paracoccus sp. TaxID=267 RepID=UPI0028989C46|nr:hypothetical protein [Paracoccus sp. (in: a-proteobacteria)]